MANNIGYDIGNNKWFLGQVPPGQNQHREGVLWKDAHGDRVKVRIPGMHPMSSNDDATEVLDSELPWAIVAKPTTHGNLNNQSSGIWGGEWVIGFFLDSDCQIPVITQVLGNNYPGEIRESTNGTTLGKRVKRYTSGNPSNNTQIKAPKVTKSKFEKKDLPGPKEEVIPPPVKEEDDLVGVDSTTPQEDLGTIDLSNTTDAETPAEAAARRERIRQKQTVERAIGKMNTGDIAVQPGGVPVNRTPTSEELQEFESKGYRYVPGSDGGGKIVKNVGQNYG